MGKKVVSKEDIIKEYKSLLNQYLSTTGSNKITRQYYREHSEFPYLYEKYFSSFDELKKTFSIIQNVFQLMFRRSQKTTYGLQIFM